METMRDHSRQNWTSSKTIEHINCGSLQRIADAVEIMSRNFVQLQNDNTYLERTLKEKREECLKLRRSVAAYRGIMKRRKK